MPNHVHRQRRLTRGFTKGFTIVELLVVIGIIALLAAIATPTIARAREQASRAKCASNLRQILMACTAYESNWSSSCPWCNWHGPEVAGYRPPGWLYQYPQSISPLVTPTFTQADVQNGSLYGFLSSTPVYHCPQDSDISSGGLMNVLTSYLMNGAACGYGKMLPGYKVTAFDSNAIMFWEADPNGPSWTAGGVYPSQGLTNRHVNGGTIGCYDNHVEWMSVNDFNTEEKKLPGRLWCNPGSKGGN